METCASLMRAAKTTSTRLTFLCSSTCQRQWNGHYYKPLESIVITRHGKLAGILIGFKRVAFDLAYRRECEAIKKRIDGMIRDIANPGDIWRLHDFLSEKREEIDEKYDYRYSVLIFVFAGLMKEGWSKASDLGGLHEDKVARIIALASM
jgi:Photoprotection regulator fluorescence recovery protein